MSANHGHHLSQVCTLEEERRNAWVGDLFIDGFAFRGSGFISVFVGFAYILGILKGNTKIAKFRDINFFILMPHNVSYKI